MRTASLAIVAAALALATSAAAQDSSLGSKVRKASATKGERRVTITPLSLDDLPVSSLPPVVEEAKQPTVIPAGLQEATDVQFIPANPADMARFKASRGANTTIYGRLEVADGRGSIALARDVQYGQYRGANFGVNCSNEPSYNNYYRAAALRWERVVPEANNAARLEVSDGWFDPRACKVMVEKRTTIRLRAIASHEGQPVAFASRNDDGISVYFVPATRIAADAGGAVNPAAPTPTAPTVYGALWRVTIPVRKGIASSVLAEMNPGDIANWLRTPADAQRAAAAAAATRRAYVAPRPLQIGVDIMQTVRDAAPSVLVRTSY